MGIFYYCMSRKFLSNFYSNTRSVYIYIFYLSIRKFQFFSVLACQAEVVPRFPYAPRLGLTSVWNNWGYTRYPAHVLTRYPVYIRISHLAKKSNFPRSSVSLRSRTRSNFRLKYPVHILIPDIHDQALF